MHDKSLEFFTYCKQCVFAKWEGNSQVGCRQNRLDIYKHKGRATEMVEDGLTFHEINTVCNVFRDQKWADKQDSPNHIQLARSEASLKVCVIVMYTAESQDLELTFESLLHQGIQPKTVILVSNTDVKNNSLLEKLKYFDSGISTIAVKIFDKTMTYRQCIDEGVRRSKNQYYLVIDAGEVLSENTLFHADRIFNDLAKPFSMVIGDNFKLIQRKLHDCVGGNKPCEMEETLFEAVEDKIKYLAEKQHNENAVITL